MKLSLVNITKQTLFWFVIGFGFLLRLMLFNVPGGDYPTYKTAVENLFSGKNPYYLTVESFSNPDIEHGYAYFPTLMYIQFFIWIVSNIVKMPISSIILWKIPTLVSELLILYILLKQVKDNNLILKSAVAFFWFLNPYLIAIFDYGLYDPILLLFTLLAVNTISKSAKLSGLLFAVAVSLKTIPLILLPLFLIKFYEQGKWSDGKFLKFKKIFEFCLAGGIYFLLISIPFMKSVTDFSVYMQGSLFVHSERSLQGRPFLTYLSYLFNDFGINYHQHALVQIYSFTALFLAFIVPPVLYYKKIINSNYSWVLLSFFIYLMLTPVLSRTHVLWLLPWLLLVLINRYNLTHDLKSVLTILTLVWVSIFLYLYNWDKGFEPQPDANNRPILKDSSNEWELIRVGRHKYYEFRGKISSLF